MNFDDYQEQIAQFAIYPEAGTGSKLELSYLALGLGGETGEVLEKVKKLIRGDGVFEPAEVAKELGDVLWYLSRLADAINLPLEHIAINNINKLTSRKQRGVLSGNGDNR